MLVFVYIIELAVIAVLTVAAMLVTLPLAMIARRTPTASAMPRTAIGLLGSVVPLAMFAWGCRLMWPWPWFQPDAMQEGFPPGPFLIMASLPALLVCLVITHSVLKGR
jgi:hypothetical protein